MQNLKSDENGYARKVASDTISCFVDMFLCVFENTNYFLFHQHFALFQKLITKMKTGIIFDFIFGGFINRSNHQHMLLKMLLIK